MVPLQLRLVRSHGNARDGVLQLAAGGVGMADALELGGERLNDMQWRAVNLCRIAWQGLGNSWQLSNGSRTLVCALNGARVMPHGPVNIAPGDVLELGLLRFVVEAAEESEFAGRERRDAPHHSGSLADPPDRLPFQPSGSAGDDAFFDLRDLVPRTDLEEQLLSTQEDPFAILDIDGAGARPPTEILSGLLEEAPALPIPRVHAGWGRIARHPKHSDAALFDELHDEFERVVRDPTQLAGRTDWEGFLAPGGERTADGEESSRKAGSLCRLLQGILPMGEDIDQVIDDFDPLGRSNLLDVDEPGDVLRLFAPEVARNTRVSVPSLTRREHHELSPDSHVQMGGAYSRDEDVSR